MKKNNQTIERLRQQGMLPLFYHGEIAECKAIIRALYDAGVRMIEYTNRGKNALDIFKQLVKTRDKEWPGLLLAAGTIKNDKDGKSFIAAGADLLISPGWIKGLSGIADKSNILWIPGCMTPTEIILAEQHDIRLVKIFPGNLLGSGYIRAIREIFPEMDFMPTGGIETTRQSLETWFRAGVLAVGMGTKLLTADLLERKDYPTLAAKTRQLMRYIQEINHPD